MKKYFVIVIILMCVTLFGCSIPNFSKEKQIPTSGTIIVQQTEYEMIPGNYKWSGKKTKINSMDDLSVSELAKRFDTLKLDKNEEIELVIEDSPDLTIYEWNEDGDFNEIFLKESKIKVSSNNGYYIYEVLGKWPDGEASYIFDVQVK